MYFQVQNVIHFERGGMLSNELTHVVLVVSVQLICEQPTLRWYIRDFERRCCTIEHI